MPMDTHTARMDLVFHLAERWTDAGEPAGIGGMVEFRTDVFDAASIATLIERLERVLVAMTTDPSSGCRRWICSTPTSTPAWMSGATGRCWPGRRPLGVDSGAVGRPGRAYA